MRAGPDAQIDVGRWDLEPVEKDAGHLVVVVLPAVHQDFLVALSELSAAALMNCGRAPTIETTFTVDASGRPAIS
jgi:hypothetical protein